jgi:hypothetical protein
MLSLTGQSPAEGEKRVDLDSLIEFSIIEDDAGIDLSSLIVEISGARAIDGVEFKNGFDGVYSNISIEDFGLSIIIDKETPFDQSQTVLVKIQAKDLDGSYSNLEYVFRTTTSEPYLDIISPENGALVKSDQVVFLEFSDDIDDINLSSINIEINDLPAVTAGVFDENYSGTSSSLKKTINGATVRIEPIESFRDGFYKIFYSVSDLSGNTLTGTSLFTVDLPQVILPSTFPQVDFEGFAHGIRRVANVGNGDSLAINWHKPISRSYKGDTYALIYENESRLNIFDTQAKYIATNETTSFLVTGLETGKTMCYAVRGLETFKETVDLTGMQEVDEGVYLIPQPTVITSQILDDDTIIEVESTDGFPSAGVLILNSNEVIRYTAKTDTSFLVPTNGRGLNGTSQGIYLAGDSVTIFFGCQDQNSVIAMATPTYSDGYQSDREIQGVGLVVTDYEDNDKKFFQGFDFCGYHQALPQDIFQGKNDCGSYLGGEFNGLRGMNLFDRMLNREEVLLDQVGEPVILLKRVWNGQTCSCSDSRRMHPKVRSCKKCFGTGYVGGYEQYNYRRRSDGRLMVMFGDTTEDLNLSSQNHLAQEYKPNCWTLPNPAIRDRDLLVRFDFNNDIEFIYEVLNITKDKLFYRHYTRQRLALQRMDKTDIVYTIPWDRNF